MWDNISDRVIRNNVVKYSKCKLRDNKVKIKLYVFSITE